MILICLSVIKKKDREKSGLHHIEIESCRINMKFLFAVLLLFIFCVCDGIQATDINEAERIIFAIDTSASMEMKDANLKIKQAIILWVKYLAPKSISVGVVQLKQNNEAILKNLQNDFALEEIIEALPDTAHGGPCLQCGLKHVTELLEMPTDKDAVLVIMEEPSIASPHDTPEYALEQIKPNFCIHTLAISENSIANLEQLAVATNGSTDYMQEVSVARLILSFALLPASKRYVIISNDECDGDEECVITYQIDSKLKSDKSILTIFVCPIMSSNATDITFNDDFDFDWDAEINCWISQTYDDEREDWELKLSVLTPVSVLVLLNNEINYAKLACQVNTGADTFDASSEDIIISAYLNPQFTKQNYKISAIVESQDGSSEQVDLMTKDFSSFSACVKPSKQTGRHSVMCYARHTHTQVNLLAAKTPSFKVDEWPQDWPISALKCNENVTKYETTEVSRQKSIQVTPTDLTIAPASLKPSSTTQEMKDYEDNKTMEDEEISPPSTFIPEIPPDNIEGNDTASNETMHSVRSNTPIQAHLNGTQITIFIVGAIIIAEVVFVMYKCNSKSKKIEQENNNLIAYSITYNDDFESRHNALNYKYDDNEI